MTHSASVVKLRGIMKQEPFKRKLSATNALNDIVNELDYARNQVKRLAAEEAKGEYHLSLLFSSPLIRIIDGKKETVVQINYAKEIRQIEKSFSESGYAVNYRIQAATYENMRRVITSGAVALHFSGHGI